MMNNPPELVELSDGLSLKDLEKPNHSSGNCTDGNCESSECSISIHSPLHCSSANINNAIVSRNTIEDSHTSYRRSLDIELTELKILFAEAQARADTLQHELVLREKSCLASELKLKEVTDRCRELEKRNDEIVEVMNHLQSNAKQSALERASLLVKVEETVSERDRYVSRYKQFRNENRTLRKEREMLRDDIEASKRENKVLKKENDRLKRKHDDNGNSSAGTHKPLSHYLYGNLSGGEKSSRSSRRKKRMTKSNGRDFSLPPWTSSLPQPIPSNLPEQESQDESFYAGTKSQASSKDSKIIIPTSSRKRFPRIGSISSLRSQSEHTVLYSSPESTLEIPRSSAKSMTLTPSRMKLKQHTTEQEQTSTGELEGYFSDKPVDIQAGMGAEIYCSDVSSPVPERKRQTDKCQSKWNWFGSISSLSKMSGHAGLIQAPIEREPHAKDEESTCLTQESVIKEDISQEPIWLEGVSQMLLPKRLASTGT